MTMLKKVPIAPSLGGYHGHSCCLAAVFVSQRYLVKVHFATGVLQLLLPKENGGAMSSNIVGNSFLLNEAVIFSPVHDEDQLGVQLVALFVVRELDHVRSQPNTKSAHIGCFIVATTQNIFIHTVQIV